MRQRIGGRQKGTPNKDKVELRAMVQNAVMEFTRLRHPESVKERNDALARRTEVEARNIHLVREGHPPLDLPPIPKIQEIDDEYDPVVALALCAVDIRNDLNIRVRCHSEAAQYLRPKLKSIQVKEDPATVETKREAMAKMIVMLDEIANERGEDYDPG